MKRDTPSRPEGRELTFDWRGRGGRPFWLALFVGLSLAGHVAGFYLFQVVYPPGERELRRPVEVTVLDPSEPLTGAVLRSIDDRVLSYDARSTLPLASEPSSAEAVRFRPVFEGYNPPLKELPNEGEAGEQIVLHPGRVYLPPVAAPSPPPPAAELPPPAPSLQLRWVGAERAVLRDFAWDGSDEVARGADSNRAVFMIGIAAAGQVQHAVPDESAGAEMDAALYRCLKAMRFEPSEPGGEVAWARAIIRW